MPFRTWLLIAAFGLIPFSDPGHAQQPSDSALKSELITERRDDEGGTDGHEKAVKRRGLSDKFVSAFQGIEAAIRDFGSKDDKEERIRQIKNEVRGLQAQEDMAFEAKRMFRASVASCVISALAFIAIFLTLGHTKRAADAATDTFDAQVRPLLVILPPSDQEVARWWAGGEERLYFKIKNVGNGVAIVHILCRSWAGTKDKELPPIYPIITLEKLRNSTDGRVCEPIGKSRFVTKINQIAIGASASSEKISTHFFDGFDGFDVEDARDIFFYGYIEYTDLGGGRYRSGFCSKLNVANHVKRHEGFRTPWEQNVQSYIYHRVLEVTGSHSSKPSLWKRMKHC